MASSPSRRNARRNAFADANKPIRVLLVSRLKKHTFGGIARSATLIAKALESVGDVCRSRDVGELLTDIPSDTDIVYHYGDLTHIKQHVAASREAGAPIIINSTYDECADKRNWLIHQISEWDPENRGDVMLAVFTHAAATDVRLRRIADRLVSVPKTVSIQTAERTFEEREGICLGDAEKLKRGRLVRDLKIDDAVEALRRACAFVPLYAYNQYGGKKCVPPKHVQLVGSMDHDAFLDWLSRMRLFCSLVSHETFAMVPAEAQSVGTVVVYRHMPQSLNEYLGFTGAMFQTPSELAVAARRLYHHQPSWQQLSDAGTLNAQARSCDHVGAALSVALRKAIVRAKGRRDGG